MVFIIRDNMNNKKQILAACLSCASLLLLIMDTKTAAAGAADGIELCLKVIIPSLFPFFLVTAYMNATLSGIAIPGLNALGRQLHIPEGSESILLLGLVGGYPVGAKMIGEAFVQKKLDKRTGQILLGYCNNAGPAFIFGVAGTIFSSIYVPLLLWLIHMLSAIITGFILPKPKSSAISLKRQTTITIPETLSKSIGTSISICGWIIVFKIILSYLSKYLSPFCGKTGMIILSGIFELSNGCLRLLEFDCQSIRFILSSAFFAFGGLCVALQTLSVTGGLKLGLYLPGKLLQTCFSIIQSILCTFFLFPNDHIPVKIILPLFIICVLTIILVKSIAEKKLWKSEIISCIMQAK